MKEDKESGRESYLSSEAVLPVIDTVSPHLISSIGSATLSKTTYNKTDFITA